MAILSSLCYVNMHTFTSIFLVLHTQSSKKKKKKVELKYVFINLLIRVAKCIQQRQTQCFLLAISANMMMAACTNLVKSPFKREQLEDGAGRKGAGQTALCRIVSRLGAAPVHIQCKVIGIS